MLHFARGTQACDIHVRGSNPKQHLAWLEPYLPQINRMRIFCSKTAN